MLLNQINFSWAKEISNLNRLTPTIVSKLRKSLQAYPMKGFELEMLGRYLRSVKFDENIGLKSIRIAILSGCTAEPISNAVRVSLFALGYYAEIQESPYGVYRQEILTPSSDLYIFEPDVIIIHAPAVDIASVPNGPLPLSDIELALNKEVQLWKSIWEEIRRNSNAVILQHVFETPGNILLGLAESRNLWSPVRFIAELNSRLMTESAERVLWADIETLSVLIGKNNWNDPRLKFHGKIAFSPKYLPEYAKLMEGIFRNFLGKTKKALILDLDNTLWGGIIGDDGLEGIQLGPETPEGEAYFAFCQYIANLSRRGVILCICSKNELPNALEVFKRHPHMPLKIEDFASVRCNWEDKASNIAAIAVELNIDQSALIFVDDNPAECELVRQSLPTVHVIQLDSDPSTFIRRLDRERLFDSQVISDADIGRAQSYTARAKAESMRTTATDLNSYLISLKMIGQISVATQDDLPRLAQMEAKTNQFNLTTRRWTSVQLNDFMFQMNHDVICFRMKDCFTDHGMVGSMILHYDGEAIKILSWVLSCRVFSRTCEEFMFIYLKKLAKQKGLSRIIGEIVPSEKNKIFQGIYERLGFSSYSQKNIFLYETQNEDLPITYISGND